MHHIECTIADISHCVWHLYGLKILTSIESSFFYNQQIVGKDDLLDVLIHFKSHFSYYFYILKLLDVIKIHNRVFSFPFHKSSSIL
mgnify:CR=1 FL=1